MAGELDREERKRLSREEQERLSTTCCGCGQPKPVGQMVCWDCFKYSKLPFKYFHSSLEDWLAARKWLKVRGRL